MVNYKEEKETKLFGQANLVTETQKFCNPLQRNP